MNRSISIPEWHRMAAEGEAPPVRILLNGGSMFPLIRMNRDYVTIVALDSEPGIGDIVLFTDSCTERFVVHRVWDIKDKTALTWGDSCPRPDGWIPFERIWGKTVLIERGRRKIVPDPRRGIIWAKFWHHGRRVYHFFRRIKEGIARRIKRPAL